MDHTVHDQSQATPTDSRSVKSLPVQPCKTVISMPSFLHCRLNDMQGMQALKSCSNNPYWFLWRHLYTPIWTCEKHWESYIPFYRPHRLKTVLPTNRPPGGYNHMHLIIMTRQFIRHRNTMTGVRAPCKPMQQWKHKVQSDIRCEQQCISVADGPMLRRNEYRFISLIL